MQYLGVYILIQKFIAIVKITTFFCYFYLCCMYLPESSHKAEVLGEELKEERSTLKAMRVELQQIKEELTDTKNEKEAIERVGVVWVELLKIDVFMYMLLRNCIS